MITITWDQLPKYLEQGMAVLEVHQLEDAQTEIVVEDLPKELELEMVKAQSKLTQLLIKVLESAKQRRGETQRISLPGGMGIDVNVGLDGKTRLQAWRAKKWPRDTEWETLIKHWPYPINMMQETKRFEYLGRCYIQTAWPTPIEERMPHADHLAGEMRGG